MSTKLNAEELAAKRYGIVNDDQTPFGSQMMSWDANKANGYAAAIREVAQPLADQRDELLEALVASHQALDRLFTRLIGAEDGFLPTQSGQPWAAMLKVYKAIEKHTPKP
jgi:CHASE3 domain sensor protein